VRLTCDPAWEASNYAAQSHDPWRALARVGRPVRVLRAESGSTCHLTRPHRRLPHVAVETVPGGGHFIPMLQQDVAQDALFEAAT
jgi:pimeloyl-ACP methyl ester carboxylesterase